MTASAKSLYIAGPMSRLPEWNFPAFRKAAEQLRAAGFEVVSPVEMDEEQYPTLDTEGMSGTEDLEALVGFDRGAVLANDLRIICTGVDGVALLPNWSMSTGAKAEWAACHAMGKPARELADWLADA